MRAALINSAFLHVMLVQAAGLSTGCGGEEPRPDFPDCSTCNYVVNSHKTDGYLLNVSPGQTICLEGNRTYGPLLFRSIKGTPEEPIYIKNCGGICKIYSDGAFGVKFEDSQNFKFLGNETDEVPYGIKITTEHGFFLTMEAFSSDFEIAGIEIAGAFKKGLDKDRAGFAGIAVKTSPYQDCEVFEDSTRTAWIMRNVSIHHNFIHDTGGEGLYVGHGFYSGRKESICDKVTYSHSIQGLKIYQNIIEDVGYDGMQIKNADSDVSVFSNSIWGYGRRGEHVHNEGLFIGEGTTGKFYNNIISTGTGNGIQFQGLGNNDIFNNLIIDPGENGFYGTLGTHAVRLSDGYINIFNNTIINLESFNRGGAPFAAFVFHNDQGGVKRFMNNLIIAGGGKLTVGNALVETASNIMQVDDKITAMFNAAPGIRDFQLSLKSQGIDGGVDLSEYGITFDIEGTQRPQGKGFDIGAFER